jgi:O-antigen/teichoic acid export membrane protein
MTGSRITLLFGLAVAAIALGLFAGDQLSQFIVGYAADLADLGFGDVGNRINAAGSVAHGR